MARAILPNPSARAEWLVAGFIDRALHHWGHVLPLDGGLGDHDHADPETVTAIPDDDNIASLASCLRSHQVSNRWVPSPWLSRTTVRTSSFVALCHPLIFSSRTSSTTTGCLGRGYLSALIPGAAGSLSIAEVQQTQVRFPCARSCRCS